MGLHQDNDTGSGANDTQDGDVLGKILFEGQGTDYSYQGGIIQVEVETGDGTATRTEQGTQMSFWTMDTSGASAERRMTIDEDGNVVIPGGELQNNSGEFTFRNTTDGENISFRTQAANTERLKIHSGGNVEVKTGDLVMGTSGKGIQFDATGNASGRTDETLDDYEEGTWNPAIGVNTGSISISYTNRNGRYTKIGRQVTAWFQMHIAVTTAAGSLTGLLVSSLPFTMVDADINASATYGGFLTSGTSANETTLRINNNNPSSGDILYFTNTVAAGAQIAAGTYAGYLIYDTP